MSKNIKISNIDSDKLLNGEMNEEGIKIDGELSKFFNDQIEQEYYDCVIGILDVDNTNTALVVNDKLSFNVYIRKDGKTVKSEPLIYREDGIQECNRMIDHIFPFSEIKKELRRNSNWQTLYAPKSLCDSPEMFKKYNTESVGDTPLSVTDVIEQFEKGRDPYYIFTNIPKFYYRTYFCKTGNSYKRCYEIISKETFDKLDDKRGFSVPSAFYTWSRIFDIKQDLYEEREERTVFAFDFKDYVGGADSITCKSIINGTSSISLNNIYLFKNNDGVWTLDIESSSIPNGISNLEIIDNKLVVTYTNAIENINRLRFTFVANMSGSGTVRFCKEKDNILVLSSPLSRNCESILSGTKNDIFDLDGLPEFVDTQESISDILNESYMDLELYYGVICYLLRLYTGHFDISEMIQKNDTFTVSDVNFNNSTDNTKSEAITCYEKVLNAQNILTENIVDFVYNFIKLNLSDIRTGGSCSVISTKNLISSSEKYIYTEHQKINFTLASMTTDNSDPEYYVDTISISNLSNGDYFITNISRFYEDGVVERSLQTSFILTKSGNGLSISRPHIESYNSNDDGLIQNKILFGELIFYSDNGNICCKHKKDTAAVLSYDYMFYAYRLNSSASSTKDIDSFKSKTVDLFIQKTTDDGTLVNACLLRAFINEVNPTQNILISELKYDTMFPMYPILFNDNSWHYDTEDLTGDLAGFSLNTEFIKDYLSDLFNAWSVGNGCNIYISLYDNPWSLISSTFENNNYYPIDLMNKNYMIGNKFSVMNLTNLFLPQEYDYYANLDFSINKSKILNSGGEEYERQLEKLDSTHLKLSINNYPIQLKSLSFYSIQDSFTKQIVDKVIVSYSENDGVVLLVNDEVETSYTMTIGVVTITITADASGVNVEVPSTLSSTRCRLTIKDIFHVFDGNIDSHLRTSGIFCQNLIVDSGNDSDGLSVELKQRTTQKEERIWICSFQSSEDFQKINNIRCFFCDDIINNPSNFDIVDSVYYYKNEYSYLEIPVSQDTVYQSECCFVYQQMRDYSKRESSIINADGYHPSFFTIGSLYNYSIYSGQTSYNYQLNPSLYSIVLSENKHHYYSNNDNYDRHMVYFDFITEQNYQNYFEYIYLYKYSNFLYALV